VKRLLIVLAALAQLALSVSPFLGFVRAHIWDQQTSVSSFASTLATYIGIQFVCLSTLVYLLLADYQDRAGKS